MTQFWPVHNRELYLYIFYTDIYVTISMFRLILNSLVLNYTTEPGTCLTSSWNKDCKAVSFALFAILEKILFPDRSTSKLELWFRYEVIQMSPLSWTLMIKDKILMLAIFRTRIPEFNVPFRNCANPSIRRNRRQSRLKLNSQKVPNAC